MPGQLIGESSTLEGDTSYGYDSNGALVSKLGGGETVTYGYNHEDRMISADIQRTENGKSVSIDADYTYDHAGFKARSVSSVSVDGASHSESRYYLTDPANFTGYTQIFEEVVDGTTEMAYVIGDDVNAQLGVEEQYLMYKNKKIKCQVNYWRCRISSAMLGEV